MTWALFTTFVFFIILLIRIFAADTIGIWYTQLIYLMVDGCVNYVALLLQFSFFNDTYYKYFTKQHKWFQTLFVSKAKGQLRQRRDQIRAKSQVPSVTPDGSIAPVIQTVNSASSNASVGDSAPVAV